MFKFSRVELALCAAVVLMSSCTQDRRADQTEPAAYEVKATVGGAPTKETVLQIIASWPQTAQFSAQTMVEQYGPPAEATPTRLIWFDNGPWKRTIVQKDEINHDFPMPHKDVMEQAVSYEVPPSKYDELGQYDGSVYVDRTRGEISARCDMEAANFVALNLAHDIIIGKRTVEDARQFYPKAVMAHMQKEPSPYAEKLMFSGGVDTRFPDETTVSPEMVRQAQQMKQAMMQHPK